jgi:hypothetical protein
VGTILSYPLSCPLKDVWGKIAENQQLVEKYQAVNADATNQKAIDNKGCLNEEFITQRKPGF